eukprot:gene11607-34312_t
MNLSHFLFDRRTEGGSYAALDTPGPSGLDVDDSDNTQGGALLPTPLLPRMPLALRHINSMRSYEAVSTVARCLGHLASIVDMDTAGQLPSSVDMDTAELLPRMPLAMRHINSMQSYEAVSTVARCPGHFSSIVDMNTAGLQGKPFAGCDLLTSKFEKVLQASDGYDGGEHDDDVADAEEDPHVRAMKPPPASIYATQLSGSWQLEAASLATLSVEIVFGASQQWKPPFPLPLNPRKSGGQAPELLSNVSSLVECGITASMEIQLTYGAPHTTPNFYLSAGF